MKTKDKQIDFLEEQEKTNLSKSTSDIIKEQTTRCKIAWVKEHGSRKYSIKFLKENGYMKDGKEPHWNKTNEVE